MLNIGVDYDLNFDRVKLNVPRRFSQIWIGHIVTLLSMCKTCHFDLDPFEQFSFEIVGNCYASTCHQDSQLYSVENVPNN